jgi:hypothetical protein
MNWRKLHAWAAILWVAVIVVQVILAGLAIANLGGSGNFQTHMDFGFNIGFVQLVALILAFPAKASGRDKQISFGLLVLYVVQIMLPGFRDSIPFIAALHPLNAMILFALSAWYARHAWRVASAPAEAPAAVAATAKAG